MGKGAKTPTTTNQNVTQTNIPAYARPYFEEILGRTSQISKEPYIPYGGQRIAQLSGDEQLAAGGIREMAAAGDNPNIARAMGYYDQAATAAGAAGSYTPGSISGIYQAGNFNVDQYDPNRVMQFMNPYIQNVLGIQMREAQRQADMQGARIGGKAANAGAFGGSRHGLIEAEHNRNTAMNLSDIYARGLSSAYDTAQGAAIDTYKTQATLGLEAQKALEAARAEQAGQAFEASKFNEAMGMDAAKLGLDAASTYANIGQGALSAADLMQTQQLQRYDALSQIGATQRDISQQGLDAAYQEFLQQRDYPKEQLAFYSGILQGLPVKSTSLVDVRQSPPNQLNSLLGMGLGAAGLMG